jgi:glutathione peroxidase
VAGSPRPAPFRHAERGAFLPVGAAAKRGFAAARAVLASSGLLYQPKDAQMSSVYDFSAKNIEGQDVKLDAYAGKTLLIVNVASKCGFTPQYKGLEALYKKHKDKGLVVLGFPCDQFGHQEPGDENEIKNFCSLTYEVDFPMFAKIKVNGDDAHPLYKYLKNEEKGILGTTAIKWNFTKFLVDKGGAVLKRYGSIDTPESIEKDLLPLLG